MQGNCSSPDPTIPKDLADVDAVTHLATTGVVPLMPRQCMLIVDKPLLAVLAGTLWVDNLYLKTARASLGGALAFISTAPTWNELFLESTQAEARVIYATNVTFQADPRTEAVGISAAHSESSVHVDGVYPTPEA